MPFAQITGDPLHLQEWAVLIAALAAFVVGVMGASVPIIMAIGKLRSEHALALAALAKDVEVLSKDVVAVKTQTDGLAKALVKSEKIVSFEAGKVEGATIEKEKANGNGT